MYKTRLQELCHQKLWKLPEYNVVKQGQDHTPSFNGVVTVNGKEFRSETAWRSSKQAQNEVAKLAFDFFSPSPSPLPNPQPQQQLQPKQPSPQPVFLISSQPEQPACNLQSPQSSLLSSFPQPTLLGTFNARTEPDNKLSSLESPQLKLQEANESAEIKDSTKDSSSTGYNLDSPAQPVQSNQPAVDKSPVVHDIDIESTESTGVKYLYKNQLQGYAQKRSLLLPVYTCECDGPPHASRFKCKVEIDGKSFECPDFFATIKDAEQAAAKVAVMSLCQDGAQEDNPGLYKNLLQEMAQKRGLGLPAYTTSQSGEVHVPVFVSTVSVGSETFEGQLSRTKKQAEMSAAKLAYTTLNKRSESISTRKRGAASCVHDSECAHDTSSCHNVGQPGPSSDNFGIVNLISKLEGGRRSSSKRIVVCPRQSNMKLPENSTILPISDDQWVAYSLAK